MGEAGPGRRGLQSDPEEPACLRPLASAQPRCSLRRLEHAVLVGAPRNGHERLGTGLALP